MEVNLRKIMSFAAIFCGCAATALFGAQDLHSGTDTDKPKQITPDASPRVENGADVFFTADFIYWSVRQEGLDFASSGFSAVNTGSTTLSKGRVFRPNFRWRPGFKVGLGLALGHDGWDLYGQYTWMNSPQKSRTTTNAVGSDQNLYSTWIFDAEDETKPLTRAAAFWSMNLNKADLEMARNYFISHYLSLRPHFGLSASWIGTRYKVNYQETATGGIITETRLRFRQRFFGIGFRGGVDSKFHFNKNWSFYANWAISALSSHISVNQTATQFNIENSVQTGSATFVQKLGRTIDTIKPTLEMAGGLAWDYWFNEDSYHVGLSLGWEQLLYMNFNKFYNLIVSEQRGDLSMQGINFRFRFDF